MIHTVEPKNLHRLSLELPRCVMTEDPTWEAVHRREWLDLESLLVQFWASHSLRSKVIYTTGGEKGVRDDMATFLPELTRRGIIDLELI